MYVSSTLALHASDKLTITRTFSPTPLLSSNDYHTVGLAHSPSKLLAHSPQAPFAILASTRTLLNILARTRSHPYSYELMSAILQVIRVCQTCTRTCHNVRVLLIDTHNILTSYNWGNRISVFQVLKM